jgi:hypothetical protein
MSPRRPSAVGSSEVYVSYQSSRRKAQRKESKPAATRTECWNEVSQSLAASWTERSPLAAVEVESACSAAMTCWAFGGRVGAVVAMGRGGRRRADGSERGGGRRADRQVGVTVDGERRRLVARRSQSTCRPSDHIPTPCPLPYFQVLCLPVALAPVPPA